MDGGVGGDGEEGEGGRVGVGWVVSGGGRGEEGGEVGYQSCVAVVGASEGEVEFAGFLEFAPEEEDGFGGWGCGGEREFEIL